MWKLKTYIFSAKISERLNGIALMYDLQEILPDKEKESNLCSDK